MDPVRLRNLGIAAHIDAGKTTLTEAILVAAGVERRAGRVDDGTAAMDFLGQERERGITISSAATQVGWAGHWLNLVDTPGHVDFTLEVERCMRVLDGAVLVVDAREGVQAQSEMVFRQMGRMALPALAFVNKCDRVGADFLMCLESIQERLGVYPLPLQYPVFDGDRFLGAVDLLTGEALSFDGARVQPLDGLPPAAAEEAGVLRQELLEWLAERDEGVLEAFLGDRELEVPVLQRLVREACLGREVLPVLCGAALRGQGVAPLLDAVVAFLPSPEDRPALATGPEPDQAQRVTPDVQGPALALAFKLLPAAAGSGVVLRLYRGTLRPGQSLVNVRTGKPQRVGRLLRMHADHVEPLQEVVAGDIFAVEGLEGVRTGDTLGGDQPWMLEPVSIPEPVMDLMVEPQEEEGRAPLGAALSALVAEDPSLRLVAEETGQWRLRGMGELHLEVAVARLREGLGVGLRVGRPQVSYRERLVGACRGRGSATLPQEGVDSRAEAELELRPESGDGPPSVAWPADQEPAPALRGVLRQALELACQNGPLHASPLIGCRIQVQRLELLGDEGAEYLATQACLRALSDALAGGAAEFVLLEPLTEVEVDTPSEFLPALIRDLGARQVEVSEVQSVGERAHVRGRAPLARMLGYATAIRSHSQGRASYTLRLEGFGPVAGPELAALGL